MESCLTKDQLLQVPQEGLSYPSYGQTSPPFELQGGFYTTLPETLSGGVVKLRKPDATTDTSTIASYFASDNYQEIKISGDNVLPADNKTTLRFNQKSFKLKFGLLHRPIWSTNGLQISLLFESDTPTLFHICIPVEIGGSPGSENMFLASWLGRQPIPRAGLSINELVNFRGSESDVRFATMEFCLKYNVLLQANGTNTFDIHPYTFCIFKNPIFIQNATCPEWLIKEPNLDAVPKLLSGVVSPFPASYRIRDFNEFFNYTYRLMKPILNQSDPYVLSAEEHFDNTRNQNVVKPAFFKMQTTVLTGRPLSYKQIVEGSRGLQNVKCYPIDLVNQVDSGGNIYIDQQSNKPMNVKDATSISKTGGLFQDDVDTNSALDESVKVAEQASRVRFWIAFSVIMLILLAILVTIIVYLFRGTSFSKTEFVPANTPVVTVPVANAPIPSAVSASVINNAASLASVASVASAVRNAANATNAANTASVASTVRNAANAASVASTVRNAANAASVASTVRNAANNAANTASVASTVREANNAAANAASVASTVRGANNAANTASVSATVGSR